jgi:hemerythrin
MALFTWSNAMSVGIERIDREHHGLVDLINLLHNEMLAGKSKDSLSGILDKLITYTKSHFANEEALFRTHLYPQAVEHKKLHDALTQKALTLQTDVKSGKGAISMSVLEFLRNWLSNHIMKEDMSYKLFFGAKGVQ